MKKSTPYAFFLLLISLLFTGAAQAQSPTFQWAKTMGAASYDFGQAIALDQFGNVYTTGMFIGTVDFDPGVGIFYLNSSSAVDRDVFISKSDSSGNFIWAKRLGGSSGSDFSNSIAVDSSGNVYTTGLFTGTADFDPGIGTYNLTSAGDYDIFISKLDSAGNFIWAKRNGSTLADEAESIVIDRANNVLSTGRFRATVDFDPNSGIFNLTSSGTYDIYILKLDSAGNFIWAKQQGGTSDDIANSIAVDTLGNVYTTGTFYLTADFDPGVGIFNLTAVGNFDVFISKLDSGGNFIWAKQIGGTTSDQGNSIAVDIFGNIYSTGSFSGTVDFDPGPGIINLVSASSSNIYVSKLDSSGNYIWAKNMGGTSNDIGKSIKIDSSGNVYTSGTFSGTADFDPNIGVYNLISSGSFDIFISKLNSIGNFVWAAGIGGINDDRAEGLEIDQTGNVYTAGYYTGLVDFDPGAGVFNSTSIGSYDIYILKMSQCIPTSSNLSVLACDTYLLNGITYTGSGTYAQTLINAAGCDSTLILNLNIQHSSYSSLSQTACNSYLLNSQTYTASGTYAQIISNVVGCDSIITLNLIISQSSTSSITQTACNSYSLNSQTYTTSGVFTQTLSNAVGCDSILSLNLTINLSSTSNITQTACESYFLNSQTYTASGSYIQTLLNVNGCDSTITLNLTIDTVNTFVTQTGTTITSNATSALYQWVLCPSYSTLPGATNQSYTPTSNGNYAVIVTQNGCIDTSLCRSVTVTGTEDYFDKIDIHIFPNPVNNNINIASNRVLQDASLNLISTTGQTLLQKEHLHGKHFNFDMSNLANGLYFIEVVEDEKIIRLKMLKE